MNIQDQFQDDEYIDAIFEPISEEQAAANAIALTESIERQTAEIATRPIYSRYDGFDAQAKHDPSQVFQLLVGEQTLMNVFFRAEAMGLSEQEEEAIRGLHIAEAFDTYADMHHVKRLPGAPSRKTSMTDMKKGEAFWMGYQNAMGVAISPIGERTRMSNHQRARHWQQAIALDEDIAKQGRDFYASTIRPADETYSMSDIIAEISREGVAGGRTGGVSAYTEEVAAVVSAINQKDGGFFVPSRRAAKGPAHKVRDVQRQRTR